MTARVLVYCSAALLLAWWAAGVWLHGLLWQPIWTPAGLRNLVIYSAGFWAFALAAPRYLRAAAAAGGVAIAIAAVGAMPVAASTCVLAAAYGLGARLGLTETTATSAGIAILSLVTGVLVRFPVNTPRLYWVLVAAALLCVPRRLAEVRRKLETRSPTSEALVIYLASIHLLAALFPEAGSDGLSMRLTGPAWVAEHAKWDFDPTHFSWALMPMGGDWAFTFAYLLAGEGAARLLHFGMVGLTGALVFRLALLFASRDTALLAAAMYLSTPATYFVTGSLFVESFWTLLLCAATREIAEYRSDGALRHVWIAGALAGAALSAKLLAAAFILPLGLALAVEAARRHAFRVAAGAAAITLAIGAPPYLEAWCKTGNPVFPLFNAIFGSPLFSTALPLSDSRYPPALGWKFLSDATFDSSLYLDGHDGSFGFQYLLLAGPAILLWRRSPWIARLCLVAGLGGGAAIVSRMGYLRYLLPAFALLCAAFAYVMEEAMRRAPGVRWALTAVVAVNTYFLAAGTSYTRQFFPPITARGEYLEETAPVRALVDTLNEKAHGEPAAFLDEDQIAGLAGKAYAASWHTWSFLQELEAAETPGAVLRLLESKRIRWIVAPAAHSWYATPHAGARGLLEICTDATARSAHFALWRLREECAGLSRQVIDRRYLEDAPVAEPGEYDDTHPALRYLGAWSHDHQFAEPFRHTLTYTAVPGNFVQLKFRGRSVRIGYTAAENRGVGEVSIDGQIVGRLDQYAGQTRWRSEQTFAGPPAGGVRVLRVSLKRDSPGAYLDVDRFVVE